MIRESKNLEWKEQINKTYLKTVSAFANYGTGKIYFGVNDKGERVGLANPVADALSLENQIQDSIRPVPDYNIEIDDEDNVVVLEVKKGKDTPYCYKNKAYKRNDTSSVEVSTTEFRNLILKSQNISFTEIPCEKDNLTFHKLDELFQTRFGIEPRFPDTYITLELYDQEEGFTNAALLASDQNSFPGVDIVVYGKDITEIRERITLENCSVFDQYYQAQDIFLQNYQYEKIQGVERMIMQKIPVEAFREMLANALVHREWQIPARIKVEFYEDGVAVTSPGGLPDGISEEDYLSEKHISIMRNKTLGLLFLKLGIIENLGNGIPMIRRLYKNCIAKPEFSVSQNTISGSLPVKNDASSLTKEQKTLYELIRLYQPVTAAALLEKSGMSKAVQRRVLNELLKNQWIERIGGGRSVKYILAGYDS